MTGSLRLFCLLAIIFGVMYSNRGGERGPVQKTYHLLLIVGGTVGLLLLSFPFRKANQGNSDEENASQGQPRDLESPEMGGVVEGTPELYQPSEEIRAGVPADPKKFEEDMDRR